MIGGTTSTGTSKARSGGSGDDATLAAISRSPGCALVLPFREKLLFAVLGQASGFRREKNQLIDHCTPGAEGVRVGAPGCGITGRSAG